VSPTWVEVDTAAAMRDLGRGLAAHLVGGDVVVLTGPLGAGKTTLVQGIAQGLGVTGAVTSPTFVLVRHHPTAVGGPDLVHVDAYRLDGPLELDDLDLTASLDTSVVVVEWGEGLAQVLGSPPLVVRIERADPDSERRRVELPPRLV
jgi:tRNA threonylcarbamoyladenosine biosynthesis protein TsaE